MKNTYQMATIALAYKEAANKLLAELPAHHKKQFLSELKYQLQTIKLPFDEALLEDLIPEELQSKKS